MRKQIPVGKLEIDPANVRPKPGLTPEFVTDIKKRGILQPLIVRPRKKGKYGIIVGVRRFLAARNAGLEVVPCDVRVIKDDLDAKAISVAENVHREDIPAWRMREVIREFYAAADKRKSKEGRIKEVMGRLNLSMRTVRMYLELDKLPADIIYRLKKPEDLSELEKRELEAIKFEKRGAPQTAEKAPIGERREERAPFELKEIPVMIAEELARDENYLRPAKEEPAKAHKIASKAVDVGRRRVGEVLKPLRERPEEEEEEVEEVRKIKPRVLKVSLVPMAWKALDRYSEEMDIHPRTAARRIIQDFLRDRGYFGY